MLYTAETLVCVDLVCVDLQMNTPLVKDKELELEDIETPHTLGGTSCILFHTHHFDTSISPKEAKVSRR
jgi:hypothetical protein